MQKINGIQVQQLADFEHVAALHAEKERVALMAAENESVLGELRAKWKEHESGEADAANAEALLSGEEIDAGAADRLAFDLSAAESRSRVIAKAKNLLDDRIQFAERQASAEICDSLSAELKKRIHRLAHLLSDATKEVSGLLDIKAALLRDGVQVSDGVDLAPAEFCWHPRVIAWFESMVRCGALTAAQVDGLNPVIDRGLANPPPQWSWRQNMRRTG
jgi:hypothetical protein